MTLFADAALSSLTWLPLVVFTAEICVVTLSTIRIIFVSRGIKVLASVLGFFEISLWLFAIGKVMQNLTSMPCCLAFAAGFTAGNYLGIIIEKKLAIGTVVVRAITHKNVGDLVERLKLAGYGVTAMDARGAVGPVKIVLTIIRRKELDNVVRLVREFDARAFYSVDEIKEAAEGIFRPGAAAVPSALPRLLRVVLPVKEKAPLPTIEEFEKQQIFAA